MRRREFLGLAGAAAVFPRVAFGQQAKRPLVVVLAGALTNAWRPAFAQGLADYGYSIGRSVDVEYVQASTIAEMPASAAKALALKPDLIVTSSAPAALAMKTSGTTLPVVFTNLIDPTALGLVNSLAHPGANMTGNTILGAPLAGKALEFLRQFVPEVSRMALFEQSSQPEAAVLRDQLHPAAVQLGIEVQPIDLTGAGTNYVPYFAQAKAGGAQAIFMAGYLVNNDVSGPALYNLSLAGGWPTVATTAVYLESGGLFSYGANNEAVVRRSGYYVDQILRGANPGSLAVELPTVLDFVINVKAAKALGVTVPPSLLLQATQVIE